MSHWRDLLMLNKLRAPVGNMRIFIRSRIHILHVVQSTDPQSTDPHYTRSLHNVRKCIRISSCEKTAISEWSVRRTVTVKLWANSSIAVGKTTVSDCHQI